MLTSAARQATENPRTVLKTVFGYSAFRGLQEAAVDHVLNGGDALVLMPTGGGKSICYQVPALCAEGMAIVVSPLIALMQDQVAALRQLGVAAGALHSELLPDEAREIGRELDAGRLKLLYVSPERLLMQGTLERLTRLPINLIAIDEAHCISQWGHEFRPEYRDMARLPDYFPGVPRLALTATADPRTRDDILHALGMEQAKVFAASFHRTNLTISVQPKIGEMTQLMDFLRQHGGETGIIYCGSRAKTERVAASLLGKGLPSLAYHAGMSIADKREALRRFREGESVIMVATIAFGMGIDRPDVRYVVHLDMPDSPESYYQQIGRAGRDGEVSQALLLHGSEDIARARHWLAQSNAPESEQRIKRGRLEAMIALTETDECRTRALLHCFGEALEQPCGHCDICITPPDTFDGTIEAQKALSTVYRTGQMFGAVHVVAVLRGEKTDAVLRHGHDASSVFGAGADHSPAFWRGVLRQLVAKGALDVNTEQYGGLFLVADRARPILRGEQRVRLRREVAPVRARKAMPELRKTSVLMTPAADAVFEALRGWRAEQARAQSIPAYLIFSDATLRDIAVMRPAAMDDLTLIRGVGSSKLERYGRAVLDILASA